MIEEESQQIKSQLEQQLIEAILDSFLNHMNQNAIFLAERLVYEHDTEEYRSLLAECYLRENQPYKVIHVLKDQLNEKYKYSYQLAVAYFRSKNIIGSFQKLQLICFIVIIYTKWWFWSFLLGQIYEQIHRIDDAKIHYYKVLDQNLTLFWIDFERLSKIGELININKVFIYQKQKQYEKTKQQSCNIYIIISNLLKNKSNILKSGSKEVDDSKEEFTFSDNVIQNKITIVIVKQKINIRSKTIFSNWSLSLNNTYLQFIKQLNENFLTLIKENWSQNDSNPGKGLQNQQSLLSQPFQLSQNLNKNFNNFNPKKVITKKFIIQLFNHHLVQQNAIPNFQKLSPQHYRLGWVLEKVSRSFMDQVKYADAERVWKEMRLIEPIRLERLHYYSSCLWHLKKQSELTYLAHSCLQISIQSPDTWIAIGNCFSFIKEIDNSIKFFGRAIQLRKDYSYAYILSGHEFSSNENCQQAKKLYGALPHLIKDNTMVGGGRVIYSLLFL